MGTLYRLTLAAFGACLLLAATVFGVPHPRPTHENVDQWLLRASSAASPLLRANVEVAQAPIGTRLTPSKLTGTYTQVKGKDGFKCPATLTLGAPEPFEGVPARVAVRVPGGNIQEDSVACTGGGLVAVDAPFFFRPALLELLGIQGIQAAVNGSAWHLDNLVWAEVVGAKLDSWTCGTTVAPWAPSMYAVFSDRPLGVIWGDEERVTMEDGNRNVIIVDTGSTGTGGSMICLMSAPPGGGGSPPPPVGVPVHPQLHSVETVVRPRAKV